MARVKIVFPKEELPFSTQLTVLVQHINYGGHLGNDAVLALVHEARIRYLRHLGCSELDAFGAGLIMTDAALVYRGEGFQGDLLDLSVGPSDLTTRGFDLLYKISCVRKGISISIADVKTAMLCFDYKNRKPVAMPAVLREKLQKEVSGVM